MRTNPTAISRGISISPSVVPTGRWPHTAWISAATMRRLHAHMKVLNPRTAAALGPPSPKPS
eukprot:CAMPEP_0113530472 /NCGR_PEP_ID=MMETSP0015_2-20120614/2955_1 /TAXON_ID=2838 /ORGANISM="Odontella" /LENGTH=61 /DNA_ID=CAMNT_0000429191 /DNA_START=301 /DNA_END=483 /DNA_ORIENTATION=+ /assembly_acc=CAM_ASM_000160